MKQSRRKRRSPVNEVRAGGKRLTALRLWHDVSFKLSEGATGRIGHYGPWNASRMKLKDMIIQELAPEFLRSLPSCA
jgi:hypothetical protein